MPKKAKDSPVLDKATDARTLFSEAFILAALPVVAYATAYGTEVGFCREFRIPTYLIEISLPDVLKSLGVLFSILALYLLVVIIWHSHLRRRLGAARLQRAAISACFWLLVLLAFIVLAQPTLRETVTSTVIVLALWGLLAIVSTSADEGQLSLRFHLPSLQAMVGVLCLVILIASPTFGRGMARRQAEFVVSAKDETLVVLRQYGDWWVVGKLSDDHKSLDPEFRIVAPGTPTLNEAESFRLKQLGPLRVTERGGGRRGSAPR